MERYPFELECENTAPYEVRQKKLFIISFGYGVEDKKPRNWWANLLGMDWHPILTPS